MGGSEAKPVSAHALAFLLQYPSACPWEAVHRATATLRACFPNAAVASYRTAHPGEVELFAAPTRNAPRLRVYAAPDLHEDRERDMVEAVRTAFKL